MQTPKTSHLQALHHALRYIQGTIGQGILLKATDQLSLHAYSDSDWLLVLTPEGWLHSISWLFPYKWEEQEARHYI